jgi:hypothetical protein
MSQSPGRTRVVIGVLADQGTPAEVAARLADDLPAALARQLSDDVDWQVETRTEALLLDEDGHIPMLRLAEERKPSHNWDVLVLLTDLPRRAGTQPIMSDYSVDRGVGLVSLPALGAVRLHHRARHLFVHLIRHLVQERLSLTTQRKRSSRIAELLLPAHHIDAEDEGIDQHLALVGVRGRLRLLAGMVRNNRPWRLVPHLSSATAAAAAPPAYGVVTSNFWNLAAALPPWRLTIITLLSIAAMTIWLLLYHRLWDRPAARGERGKTLLYNMSTLVTLLLGVACMYVILYVLTLLAAIILIDGGYLAAELRRPVGFGSYAIIAWLASSIGIVAGALGSSIENKDAVRRATYSVREQERQVRREREEPGQY